MASTGKFTTAGRWVAAAALLASALVMAPAVASPGASTVPNPTVEGPIPFSYGLSGRPQTDHTVDMAEYGYIEEEYFLTGTARAADGSTAEYTTRAIVRRPADPGRFNGTLIAEWNNVTAQHDQTPDWFWARPMVLREGYAYAIVSAQAAGFCCAPLSLQAADPVRYASLSHPGDAYANDIFSQAVQALRNPAGVDPTGGLPVRRVLAAGHSQSASRLHAYVQDAHPAARVIDGFLIDGGGSKDFREAPLSPVLHLLEEMSFTPAEPNQTNNYRLWEVPGATHGDYWILRQQFDAPERALPQAPKHTAEWGAATDENAGNWGYDLEPRQLTCAGGGGMFPKRYAVSAALVRLDRWVRTGRPAPAVPRVQFTADGTVARDAHGNALGGLRLPPIDVPVARYVADACLLFGITIPLDPITLQQLYPTHDVFVARMEAATADAVRRGVLIPADAEDILRRARKATVPTQGFGNVLPSLTP
jgi:hypothetical protein